ncbi:MAG: monovalent cation/H+ antiporter complex subunit F [Gemmatimonadales bacterium]
MTGAGFLQFATVASATMLVASGILVVIRILRGPSAADRIVGLDMLGSLGVSAAAIAVIASGSAAFIDIALGIALVGFLGTVAFGAFMERGSEEEEEES